ncbi:unnamed protein product [Owenia fusiformis]|uniref:Uncharacterized protein n=1 Tax=Owenia fusiformis TaxID=6347 RepID=A0A8J1TCW3_OWEFU|nr:unnamed protein product [Owenia fusiformis]
MENRLLFISITLAAFLCYVNGQSAERREWCHLLFNPVNITDLHEGQSRPVLVNYTCIATGEFNVTLRPKHPAIFAVDRVRHVYIASPGNNFGGQFNFSVRGLRLGRSSVVFEATGRFSGDSEWTPSTSLRAVEEYRVLVIRKPEAIYDVFLVILALMLVLTNFGFGCRIDPEIVKAVLKKPIQPAIGFVCQFGIMPPLALGIAKMLQLDGVTGLGLLTIGASAGGGGSNIFTFLFNADISLSIVMTFISTLAALGMTTFWIWALGPLFRSSDGRVYIPVDAVISSLLVVIVPVVIGVITRYYHAKIGDIVNKILRPFVFIFALMLVTVGLYVYLYAFALVTWRIWVASTLLPWIGFTLGGGFALLFRQDKSRIVTIAFETGMQNIQLALFMNRISLGDPEADLANVPVIWYLVMSLVPPFIIAIGVEIKKCVDKRKHGGNVATDDFEADDTKASMDVKQGQINIATIYDEIEVNPAQLELTPGQKRKLTQI